MKKLGGLWKHESKKDGKTFFSGTIEVVAGYPTRIIGFFPEPKKDKPLSPNAPVLELFLAEDKPKPKEEAFKTSLNRGGL